MSDEDKKDEEGVEKIPLPNPEDRFDAFRYALDAERRLETPLKIRQDWFDEYLRSEQVNVSSVYHYHLHITGATGKSINFLMMREEEVIEKYEQSIELILDLSMDAIKHQNQYQTIFRSGSVVRWVKCDQIFKCFTARKI